MARLPQPGSDDGSWGVILNDYLLQSHQQDGALRAGSVGATQLQSLSVTAAALADDSVIESKLAPAVQVKLNAVGVAGPKGDTGDVGPQGIQGQPGATSWTEISDIPTSFSPTAHTHTSSDISDSTAMGRSLMAVADASAARGVIGAGTSSLALGVTSTTAKAGDYAPTKADVGLANVDNTTDIDKPVSTAQAAAIAVKYTKPGAGIPEADFNVAVQTKLNSSSPFIVVATVDDVPPGTAVGTVVVVTG